MLDYLKIYLYDVMAIVSKCVVDLDTDYKIGKKKVPNFSVIRKILPNDNEKLANKLRLFRNQIAHDRCDWSTLAVLLDGFALGKVLTICVEYLGETYPEKYFIDYPRDLLKFYLSMEEIHD